MPDDELFYPPAQYGAGWLLLVLAVIAVVVAVAILVAVLTRPRRLAAQPTSDPAAVIAELRGDYLGRIDEIERQVTDGSLDARRAHAELSRSLRSFVNEYSGLEAPVMTLHDLVTVGVHPGLVDTIGRFTYPSVFRREAPLDPALAVDAARQVVQSWR